MTLSHTPIKSSWEESSGTLIVGSNQIIHNRIMSAKYLLQDKKSWDQKLMQKLKMVNLIKYKGFQY